MPVVYEAERARAVISTRFIRVLVALITIVSCRPWSAVDAQTTPPPSYSADSPHWSHINVCDFGRALKYLDQTEGTRQAACEWYARHVDMTEVGMANFTYHYSTQPSSVNIKTYNPTIKTFGYDIDLTVCQHEGCTSTMPATAPEYLPASEDQYLHFSETTTLKYYSLQNALIGSVTVPGCPDTGSLSPACRVRLFIYNDYRWLPNLKSAMWREWYASHLISEMNNDPCNSPYPVDGLFLDEHGPGFYLCFGIGVQTKITSGGGILEYGGRRPSAVYTPNDALDLAYNADAVNWLTELRARLEPAGKFMHINTAEYFMDPLGFSQSLAAKGAMTELLHAPDHFRSGASIYRQFIDQVHQMTSGGASVDLAYTWCAAVPAGYTAGNYRTAVERYRMWNLASYYMVRERPGEPGRAYFNPNLCVNVNSSDPLDFEKEWLAAYESDVGQPQDSATVLQHGALGCSTQGYTVFARHYTNALVLVRPRDDMQCTDYGDDTAVDVPLTSWMVMLEPDGTFSPWVSSVAIRNAEAVILFSRPDTIPPSKVRDMQQVR